jgi:hypothetical protein
LVTVLIEQPTMRVTLRRLLPSTSGFIDDDNKPTQALHSVAVFAEEMTRAYNVSGDTRLKATRFFLNAAAYIGIQVS